MTEINPEDPSLFIKEEGHNDKSKNISVTSDKEETSDVVTKEIADVATKDEGTKATVDCKRKRGKTEDDAGIPVKQDKEKPKAKKMRVKPEKAQEVRQKLLDELVKNHGFGMTEVPMDTLAVTVGYKHPRSDAILAAMKLLKEEGLVARSKDNCKLTDKGVKEYVPEAKSAENPEEAMDLFWKQLEAKLGSSSKSSNEQAHEAAKNIWELLQDGKAYDIKELVDVTSYTMERSTGFGEIMKFMRQLGFIEKVNKKTQFTDKVFPFGRP